MLMWGFLQVYIAGNASFFARAGGTFIGAVLLWDILFRGQLGFSISFLEEMWARNMGNLMISPLRPIEFVTALMIMSLVRLAIGMVPVTILAIGFFDFNLYGLGFALAAFFANLILTSWAIGILVSGLVLRNGLGAESLAYLSIDGMLEAFGHTAQELCLACLNGDYPIPISAQTRLALNKHILERRPAGTDGHQAAIGADVSD